MLWCLVLEAKECMNAYVLTPSHTHTSKHTKPGNNRRRQRRGHRGHQQPISSSSTPHESSIRTASPLPLVVLGRRAEQPPSARTGQFHRQQEVKMQRIRSLLLASLSINLVRTRFVFGVASFLLPSFVPAARLTRQAERLLLGIFPFSPSSLRRHTCNKQLSYPFQSLIHTINTDTDRSVAFCWRP